MKKAGEIISLIAGIFGVMRGKDSMAQNTFDYGRQIMIVSLVGITLLAVVTGCNNKGISMTGNSNKEVTSDNQKAEPTLSPEPTIAPTPTPEPTLSPEAIFDQNIHDFLNFEGEYTQQKTWDNIILSINNKANLGVTQPAEPSVEGFLIDYLKKDDNMVVMVGFDGKDGKRFVTEMAIPTGLFDQSDQMGFNFVRLDSGTEASSHTIEEKRATEKTTIKYLELLKGKPVILSLQTEGFSEDTSLFKGSSAITQEWVREGNKKVNYSRQLLNEINLNGFEIKVGNVASGTEIKKITNFSDIEKIEVSKTPNFRDIEFYKTN